jgi:hypothetical protein
VLSLGVKQPGFEADHLPLSSAEVKSEWSYTSTLPYAVVVCTGTPLPFLIIAEPRYAEGT